MTALDLDELEKLAKAWPPLGEPCHVPNFRYAEWRTIQLFFAGITYRPGLVPHVDIWLAEKWPPEHPGHITDGFGEDDVVFDNWKRELRTARAASQQGTEITDAMKKRGVTALAAADQMDLDILPDDEAANSIRARYKYIAMRVLTAALNPNGEAK